MLAPLIKLKSYFCFFVAKGSALNFIRFVPLFSKKPRDADSQSPLV